MRSVGSHLSRRPLPYSDDSLTQTCPGAFEHERLAIGDRATGNLRLSVRYGATANGYRSGCMPFLRLIASVPYDAGAGSTLARLAPGAEARRLIQGVNDRSRTCRCDIHSSASTNKVVSLATNVRIVAVNVAPSSPALLVCGSAPAASAGTTFSGRFRSASSGRGACTMLSIEQLPNLSQLDCSS